jgi:hypothetical protein
LGLWPSKITPTPSASPSPNDWHHVLHPGDAGRRTWSIDALVGGRSGSDAAVQVVAGAARELVVRAVAMVAGPAGILMGRTHDDPPASIAWMANPRGPASSRT